MNERCDDLDQFFDQELGAEAAQEFREHLATCARCQRVLLGRMLEAAVIDGEPALQAATEPAVAPMAVAVPASRSMEDAAAPDGDRKELSGAPVELPQAVARGTPGDAGLTTGAASRASTRERIARLWGGARRPARTVAAALATAAAAAAVAVMMCPHQAAPTDIAARVALSLAPARGVEVRFSAPALDHHRRYGVDRAVAAAPVERIKLQDLSELEQRGDTRTLMAALALNGELASAERTAKDLPHDAASLSDRAALELLRADSITDPAARPAREAAAQRALSLTAEALRLDPKCAQAAWNQAIALRRLGLTLVGARVLDEIARRGEPGWADEARVGAERIRQRYKRDAGEWKPLVAEVDRMVRGGPVLGEAAVAHAPSLARDAFYQAVATAATADRLEELGPLARALDARFATTALGELLVRVRASDLAARAPLSAALRDAIDRGTLRATVRELRARALARGVRDVVLASFLAISDAATEPDDLPALDQAMSGERDPWWRLVQLARHAWVAGFVQRDYPAVDAAERLAAPICETIRSAWCGRISLLAGSASSQMGRADLAIQQITSARWLASDPAVQDPEDDLNAIDGLGQAIAIRVTDDLDSAAVAGAYLEESSLRLGQCKSRLQQMDFAANAALQHHRFDEAARVQRLADQLQRGDCKSEGYRLNGETARLQLALRGQADLATLRDHLAQLAAEPRPQRRLYLAMLGAGATVAEDRARGAAALRQVIDAATADPGQAYAPVARAAALDVLVDATAASGDASGVLALLAERLGTTSYPRCVLGVASWSRLVVAARDADGNAVLETREIPAGLVMIPPAEVVSPAVRAKLAGCRRVEVLAPAPYFGAPRLLGDDLAWVYHTPHPVGRPAAAPAAPQVAPAAGELARELVVSDVTPPEHLRLPALQPFSGGESAKLLSGARATPDNVLAEMRAANLIVIVAHGFTDAQEPTAASLVLSPDARGDYLLTASKVSSIRLTGSPAVVLAGCDAGRVQVSAEPWSLATSFVQAGARVVLAPTEPIPDASASDVFRGLIGRIRGGVDPVEALAAERNVRGATAGWLSSIVVFE
ncbi:MAG TPA: CHAT domain-containing protein [Kofleriaceae bacterium]|nr:CHAT domain-containing protein [Kofleriaceae bacterium]